MSWMDALNAVAAGKKRTLTPEEREDVVHEVVLMSSLGAAAVTLAPIPLSDFFVVTPLQIAMVSAVGRVYGRVIDFDEAKHLLWELGSVCGLSLVAQKGFATLTKLVVPGLGGIFAGPYAFAVTYAMGVVAISYFEDTEQSRSAPRKIFKESLLLGKRLFSRRKVADFQRRYGQDVDDFTTQKHPPVETQGPAGRASVAKAKKSSPKRRARR